MNYSNSLFIKKRIVVAEDDKDMLLIIMKLLRGKGYEVLGLTNGTSIVEGLGDWPDLFVLDKEMDFIDGVAITKYLKMHTIGKTIPIVMLSGSSNRKNAAAAGVDFYMEKPFSTKEFLDRVDHYLNPAGGHL